MLCLGRDENGYPTKGIDLVPEWPKPREPLNKLITLLEQSNEQLTQLKQQADLVKLTVTTGEWLRRNLET